MGKRLHALRFTSSATHTTIARAITDALADGWTLKAAKMFDAGNELGLCFERAPEQVPNG